MVTSANLARLTALLKAVRMDLYGSPLDRLDQLFDSRLADGPGMLDGRRVSVGESRPVDTPEKKCGEFWRKIWWECPPDKGTLEKPEPDRRTIIAFQVVLLILSWFVGEVARYYLNKIGEATYLQIDAVLWGLETTLLLGLLSGWLLNTYITVKYPAGWEKFDFERQSGGSFLGFLERLIFFASFYHANYFIGGAWLVFKLGAKWGVWQHVIKYPEAKTDSEAKVLDDMLHGNNSAHGFLGGS